MHFTDYGVLCSPSSMYLFLPMFVPPACTPSCTFYRAHVTSQTFYYIFSTTVIATHPLHTHPYYAVLTTILHHTTPILYHTIFSQSSTKYLTNLIQFPKPHTANDRQVINTSSVLAPLHYPLVPDNVLLGVACEGDVTGFEFCVMATAPRLVSLSSWYIVSLAPRRLFCAWIITFSAIIKQSDLLQSLYC